MKKIMIPSAILILTACSNSRQKTPEARQDTAIYYPYTPEYSQLAPGNPAYAKKVLEVWRAYETGNVLSVADHFSDSVQLIFKDSSYRGKRDSILNIFQRRRNAYTVVQAYVDSWLPVHAKDANADLVLLWGKLDCTGRTKRAYLVVHEIWSFDSRGKIKEMVQYLTYPH